MNLYEQWIDAKTAEGAAVKLRRKIEDQLSEKFEIPADSDGSKTIKEGGYKVQITSRLNREVDSDKIQEIAIEKGIPFRELHRLFRWKVEVNKKEFVNSKISDVFVPAIETKPGRPSYKIERIEEEK
jgi:uncharacterized protein (DUF111 family)